MKKLGKARYVVQFLEPIHNQWHTTNNLRSPYFTNRKTAKEGMEKASKTNTLDNFTYRVYDRIGKKTVAQTVVQG